MRSQIFGNKLIVRIDKGEELIATLIKACEEHNVTLGSISGIGATNKLTIGLFETATKEYHSTELTGDYEIAPVSGNVSTMDGKLYIHLHINVCDAEHKCFGGHLNSAIISATCECFIDIADGQIDRVFSDDIGLNLIELPK